MVQGINPNFNNTVQTAPMPIKTEEAASAAANTASDKGQGMQMMPSMPMPAQVDMSNIQLPPQSAVTTQSGQDGANADGTTTAAAPISTASGDEANGVLNPPNVSNNPLNDRYGFIKDDLYGDKNGSNMDFIPSQGLNLFPENSSYYNPDKPAKQSPLAALGIGGNNGNQAQGTKQSNPLMSLLKAGVLVAGGVLLFKTVKKSHATKNLADTFGSIKNTLTQKTITEIDEFKDFFDDIMADVANFGKRHVQNIKLNLKGQSPDEVRDLLSKTTDLAKEYSRLPTVRPKCTIFLKEGTEALIPNIGQSFKESDIASLSDNILNAMEEIRMVGEKVSPNIENQSNTLFEFVTRKNFNTNSWTDNFTLAGANLKKRISNLLSK